MTLAPSSALRVSKNAVARLLTQIWAKLLALVLVALVARYETAEGLGRYVLVLTVVSIVAALSDAGLNTYLTREVAREDDHNRHRLLLGTVLSLKIGLSVVGGVALAVVAGMGLLSVPIARLLPLGGLLLLPEAAAGAMRAFVNGRQRMEVSGAIDMIIRLAAVLASVPALMAGFGVTGVLACTVGATLLGVLLYGLVLRRWGDTPLFRWSPGAWRSSLKESYPFAITSIAAMLYARVDLLLLGLWQGEAAAGWYAAAYRLWETMGLLPASLLEAMFPEMSRLASADEGKSRLRSVFRRGGWAMLVAGVALAALGTWAAPWLVSLVYGTGENYDPTVLVFQILVWAIPAMFLYLLGGHVLYALDRQRRVTVVMLLVGVFNIGLNLIVIPRWSYVGCAAVALLSEWLLWALLYPQARRSLTRRTAP